jgi:DNA polymerase-3 subunit epsilon/ATP-dependent DNA helicase DinG
MLIRNNEMVRNAPALQAVIQDLAGFVGGLPVLGHNIRFDLSFLQPHKILRENEVLDTYELAAVMMPTASRYNLGALGQQLGILLPATHRALDDARVTHAVYAYLYDMGMQLPTGMVSEFVRLSDIFNWGAGWVFKQILRMRMQQPGMVRQSKYVESAQVYHPREEFLPPLEAAGSPQPLDEDEAAALLEYGGPFSRYFDHYEYRLKLFFPIIALTIIR